MVVVVVVVVVFVKGGVGAGGVSMYETRRAGYVARRTSMPWLSQRERGLDEARPEPAQVYGQQTQGVVFGFWGFRVMVRVRVQGVGLQV